MDRLCSYLDHTQKDIEGKLAAGQVPNPQQLAGFLTSLTTQVRTLSSGAPKRIIELIVTNFHNMGWDPRSNKQFRSRAALMTPPNVVSSLSTLSSELASWKPPITPTPTEMKDLAAACDKLWELDSNRCVAGEDIIINPQYGKSMWEQGDFAEEKLFTYVDAAILEKPTYKAFHALLDNYSSEVGVREVVTPEELVENRKFLDMIMDTSPMQYVWEWLKANSKTKASTREAFIAELNELWFGLYRRKVEADSSGFEHVFCGEVRDSDRDGEPDEVTGLHNWIVLYKEEMAGRLDYQGFIKPRRQKRGGAMGLSSSEQLITLQFVWNGCSKPCSSSFIGVSPEFEMALYTLCFMADEEEKNEVQCGPYRVLVTAYRQRHRGKDYIGTSFPSEAPLSQAEGAARIQKQFRNKKFNQKHGRR